MGEVSRYPNGTFCWVDLETTDVAAAKVFYGSLYGWEMEDIPAGEGTYTMCRLDGHDVAAMYEPLGEERAASPHWNSHISVDDLDTATEKAKDLGANVIAGPLDVRDTGRLTAIQDPTGALVYLWQPKSDSTIGARLVNEPGTWTWNELATRDPDGARAFYGELFGWGSDELVEGQYFGFTLGELLIGSMRTMVNDPPQAPPSWMPYFVVPGCDEAAGRVQELGGEVLVLPTDIPAGRFAVIRDPTGIVEIPEGPAHGVDGS